VPVPRRAAVAAMFALALAACDGSTPALEPCGTPAGCLRADRVDGSCQCQEWEIVAVEPVPVKYLVVGIIYAPPGSWTEVDYGQVQPGDYASDLGARWRSVVRAADGAETVASIGPGGLDPQSSWPYSRVSAQSGALTMPASLGMGLRPQKDLAAPEEDIFLVWVNPAAAVVTNFAGERSVSWSWRSDCAVPGGCDGVTIREYSGYVLTGTRTPVEPILSEIAAWDAADRAAILAHDPRLAPGGFDPAALAGDPRFQSVGPASISPGIADTVSTLWAPCADPLTDEGFAALHEATAGFGDHATLAIQYGALATSTVCTPQQPRLVLATGTAGCSMGVGAYLDRRFGTVLAVPSSPTAECTR